MGSHMNFRSYGDSNNPNPNPIGDESKPPANLTLVRQSSVYSLTFEEFQSTMGGLGKDFGSMNMDELLKNIWTAEESQAMAMSASANGEGNNSNTNFNNSSNNSYGNLQRQGSLTLPRTLSQKTVDEVWRDFIRDSGSGGSGGGGGGANRTKDNSGGATSSATGMPQRQPTLGEMTLEEFLVRAGVVREDNMPLQIGRPNSTNNYNNNNNNQWFNNSNNNTTGLVLGFQQPNGNLGTNITMVKSNNPVSKEPPTLLLNHNPKPNQQQQSHHQPPLFPKPANVAFATAAAAPSMYMLNNSHLAGSGARGGMLSTAGNMGGSPACKISPEVMTKSAGDTSSLSPVPYVINRGRKCSAIEKVVERRQRRMIKNRESAARSRARKQAYTLELEAEVQKLREINEELEKKQADFMEMQKNEALETLNRVWGSKRQCLRRTLTGPW